MNNLLERFLKYVSIETTSDPNSNTHPSSYKEFDLIDLLEIELKELGLKKIFKSNEGYLYAMLPKNTDEDYYTIGLIAHVDTSSDMSGKDIKAQIIENYDGKDIVLNNELNIIMETKEFPFLKNLKGRTLITTDGTTLLGADDKAGIAEILTAIDFLIEHPEIEHGDIYIAFTPDEEIGEGTLYFDLDKFPCDFAYTVDGGQEGEINYENFNAASAIVEVKGINIHPGSAKDHMVNSMLIAMEFNSLLDPNMIPAKTELYEGFNHLNSINGSVENTTMHYIIRNHDKTLFEKQKNDFLNIEKQLNDKYPSKPVKVRLNDSYYNMYDIIKDHMNIVEIAIEATKKANVEVSISPIRGGTDGATLTYKGLNTPNLGTGGYNFHGKYECITLEGMEKVVQILLNIIKSVQKESVK